MVPQMNRPVAIESTIGNKMCSGESSRCTRICSKPVAGNADTVLVPFGYPRSSLRVGQ